MALSRDAGITVKARAERDPAFRQALPREAVDSLLSGEVEVGQAMPRACNIAAIGFEAPVPGSIPWPRPCFPSWRLCGSGKTSAFISAWRRRPAGNIIATKVPFWEAIHHSFG